MSEVLTIDYDMYWDDPKQLNAFKTMIFLFLFENASKTCKTIKNIENNENKKQDVPSREQQVYRKRI